MKTKAIALILALGLLSTTGCVTNKKFNALQSEYNESQLSLAAANTNIKSLETQLSNCQSGYGELRQDYANLQKTLEQSIATNQSGNVNISKLVDEINASNSYIKRLVEAKSKSDSLLMVLSNNLTRSLDTSELRDVDVKVLKGVVYISLADNMLFRSGSYEISPDAMDILSKIAKIIKDYKNYSVLVEGNTDNVPIKRTNIRNNWDLSTLRASSVVQVLQNDFGVDPQGLLPEVAVNTIPWLQTNRPTDVSSTAAHRL